MEKSYPPDSRMVQSVAEQRANILSIMRKSLDAQGANKALALVIHGPSK